MSAETRQARLIGIAVVLLLALLYVAAWRLPDPLSRVALPQPTMFVGRSVSGGSRLLRWRSVTYVVAGRPEPALADLAAQLAATGWHQSGDGWTKGSVMLRLRGQQLDASQSRLVLMLTRG
mgnify:CR=1 FL=1